MLASLAAIADTQGGVFTRAQALAAGYADGEIRARARSGAWRRLRHGVYVVSAPLDRRDEHVRRCWAALLVAGPDSVVTGISACVVHGLDLVDIPTQVHVASLHPRTASGVTVRRATFPSSELTEVSGLRVTTLARSAVEAARSLDHADAVVVLDSALRVGTLTRTDLDALLGEGRDVVRARRAVRFADGRSESVGESLARVAIAAAGLPAPDLQVPFVGPSGRHYRVDFFWPEHRTIGEFDGRVKYGGEGQTLWEEKRREDDLRSLGLAFVRFGTTDVRRPTHLGALVRGAFGRGRRLST